MSLAFWQRAMLLNAIEAQLTKPADLGIVRTHRQLIIDDARWPADYDDALNRLHRFFEVQGHVEANVSVTRLDGSEGDPSESTVRTRYAPYKRILIAIDAIAAEFTAETTDLVEAA